MSFESWQQDRPQNPPWMRGKNTGALVGGLGKVKDQLLARLRAGILARFPDTRFAADDALGYKGAERLLPRGPGESSAAYAARLKAAWETWSFAGSHGALLRQLEIAGFGAAHIIQDNGWWTKLGKAPPDFTARLASVANLTTWTLATNTLTAPTNGATTFDASVGLLGDVILVPLRSPGTGGKGVYTITQAGDSTHPTILTRAVGWQSGNSVAAGTAVLVTAGATLAGHQYETETVFTVGSGAPHFDQGLLSGGVIFGDTSMDLLLGRPRWVFDARTDFWSRFMILWTSAVSGLATAAGQQALRAIVDRWRPAYATYVGSVQITAGDIWGWPVDRAWGAWTWGGSTTIFLGP